ncbi:MAG TPA: hypothetical protein VHL14_07585 [Steroidobacteraceae bacterium]|nr:hypothetical protein [Steroidobacteraceae bacterium]
MSYQPLRCEPFEYASLMHDPRPTPDAEEQPVPETPEPAENIPVLPHPSDDYGNEKKQHLPG